MKNIAWIKALLYHNDSAEQQQPNLLKASELVGRLEEAVLVSMLKLSKPSSAADICDLVEQHLGNVTSGVLYMTLDRMAKKGLLSIIEPENVKRGQPRMLFLITVAGKNAARASLSFSKHIWEDVPENWATT